MLIPTPRFLALPLIAIAVITALGVQAQAPRATANDEAKVAPVVQHWAHGAKTTFIR